MSQYELVNEIKNKDGLRKSFNELAEKMFDINFEEWHQNGFWSDNYIPYSLVREGEVIANASITKSKMIINEKVYQTIQIGTVMTDSTYQGQGLSKYLIEKIINDYQNKVDFIYLFANETVLEFYPKFGFKRVDELAIQLKAPANSRLKKGLTQINFKAHQKRIEAAASVSTKNHLTTYLMTDNYLRLFYYGTVFAESIYYIEELKTYLSFEIEDKELHLFDILSDQAISLGTIIDYLLLEDISVIHCHFNSNTTEVEHVRKIVPMDEDALFVLGIEPSELSEFKLPLFNHA